MRRLVPDGGRAQPGELGGAELTKGVEPGGRAWRRKAQEQERMWRQSGHGQGGDRSVRTWYGGDDVAAFDGGAHQPEAGVGQKRRPCVRDEGESGATVQERHQMRDARLLVVLVQRLGPDADAQCRQQSRGGAGVLAEDEIGLRQGVGGSPGYITKVADGRGNEHKSGAGA